MGVALVGPLPKPLALASRDELRAAIHVGRSFFRDVSWLEEALVRSWRAHREAM